MDITNICFIHQSTQVKPIVMFNTIYISIIPKLVRNRCVIRSFFVGAGAFVIELSQISSFFSANVHPFSVNVHFNEP